MLFLTQYSIPQRSGWDVLRNMKMENLNSEIALVFFLNNRTLVSPISVLRIPPSERGESVPSLEGGRLVHFGIDYF